MLAGVGILVLGRKIEIVGIERFDANKGLIASSLGREFDEAAAAAMLGALALAFGQIGVARSVHIDLHHEGELRKLLFYPDQPGKDFLPSRAAEKIVIN